MAPHERGGGPPYIRTRGAARHNTVRHLTRHGVVLAEAVDHKALIGVRQRRLRYFVVVANAVVDFVGNKHDALLFAHLCGADKKRGGHRGEGVTPAGRNVRRQKRMP